MLRLHTLHHFAPNASCFTSFLRFNYGGFTGRHVAASHKNTLGKSNSAHVKHVFRRFRIPHSHGDPNKASSTFLFVSRGLYVAGAVLTTAGVVGWGLQEIMPERTRTWAVLRCGNAVAALVALSVDYKLLGWWDMSGCHRRSAQRLVRLAERNGGVYVKVGQHASAMEYLLPIEYTQQLQQLQRNAPASSMAQVEEVVKQELKIKSLDEVFQHFDETPVGAASLAQVHFAVLSNGQPVAVKVQHADVRKLAEVDTRVVEVLTKVAAKIFPEVRFEWLVDLLRENLPAELDFRKEATNAKRCRQLLEEGSSSFKFALPEPSRVRSLLIQHAAKVASWFWLLDPQIHSEDVALGAGEASLMNKEKLEAPVGNIQPQAATSRLHSTAASASAYTARADTSQCLCNYEVELYVPRVYSSLTTSRVLVMERCEGVPVDDLHGVVAQGIHPLAVSEALSELYGRLIFDLGFVHADPHPGNVIVHLEKCPHETQGFQEPQLRHHTLMLLSSLNGKGDTEMQNLRGDIAAVTACANEFGVGELAGLLAVILSLRSEDSINSGLQLSRKTPE
ncbi:hypothetical protein, conserved [Eimeria necatrix]|uniref:ABC1 atypical kinase-like domain-containing protein n=1 Tax=Eimeria necatrix TaxID=51315 RepID=U6MXD0_9EIME|nr:hypothetical protein, conserved [Eimeria necatrix]CDJ66370.1 hypothetical protein, conserved [Eimeria necatrix]